MDSGPRPPICWSPAHRGSHYANDLTASSIDRDLAVMALGRALATVALVIVATTPIVAAAYLPHEKGRPSASLSTFGRLRS